MHKHFLLAVAVFSFTIMALPSFSVAEQTGGLMAASHGSTIYTTLDDKYPVDPVTGKRPGILDWDGMGRDTSQHPDGPLHDSKTCGICR